MRSKSVFQTFVLVFFSSSDEIKYYENGKVKELRHYKAGNKVGKWVWYNEDGSVEEETAYQL